MLPIIIVIMIIVDTVQCTREDRLQYANYYVCVFRREPAWLSLYKAGVHFIELFRDPAAQHRSLPSHQGTDPQASVPRGAPLVGATLLALLGRGFNLNLPCLNSSALHTYPQRQERLLVSSTWPY